MMQKIPDLQCKTCQYFGSYHEKGSMLIGTGTIPINEPYVTCSCPQHFHYVLAYKVPDCKHHKFRKEDLPFPTK